MQVSLSNWQLSILISLWLLICAVALWWLEYRHWSSWQDQLVLFSAQQTQQLKRLLPKNNGITVMHIRSEDCPCTNYQDSHIEQLQATLKKTSQITLEENQRRNLDLSLVTPSVAIWDKYGDLAYFGPYSSGAVCGQGEGFVARILLQLGEGKNPQWTNTQGVGCFCRDQFAEATSAE